MSMLTIQQLYERYIKTMPPSEQLKLVELIALELARSKDDMERPKRSLMELHGLGAEIWEGIDAQEYVNKLRAEWDHRP
ncbi:MAG: hypothetical protein AAB354_13460 [candidate division KSB1 bacterium]